MAKRAAAKAPEDSAKGRSTSAGPPQSRAEYVFQTLRAEILAGALPPGAALPQDEIATRLGVSITPVREALRRLESAGLVTYLTHFGASVTELSQDAAEEFYLLRAAVEGLSARLAARRITDEQLVRLRSIHADMEEAQTRRDVADLARGSRQFHAVVAEAGGPALIAAHLRWMWESYPVPTSESAWQFADVAAEALDEHARLVDALAAGDPDAAERLMQHHIKDVATKRNERRQRPTTC